MCGLWEKIKANTTLIAAWNLHPPPADDKILVGSAGAWISPFSCRFLHRHQADHYSVSSWDHNVISSAICLHSFFISSHPLLRFTEELLCGFALYLPKLSGEKVSLGGWSLPWATYRGSACSWNAAEERAPPFQICRCDSANRLARLQAKHLIPYL